MKRKIFKYTLAFISSLLLCATAYGQSQKPRVSEPEEKKPFVTGQQVFFNLAGVVLWQFTDYGEIEGGLRANLGERFLPVIEAGLGICDKTHDETDIHYKTSGPFARIGCDYNFIKNPASGNKLLGGLRFGYTSFKYDMDAPPLDDPYWQGEQLIFNFKDVKSKALWMEFVFGLETKIWKRLELGWTVRYKRRLNHKTTPSGSAWYIPGYGENDGHLFTGTFNVIIDI